MQEFKSKPKLIYWPTPQDYHEAVQNLHVNAHDPELQSSHIETGPLGLPRVISGSFASVYKVHSQGHDLALRCFLRDVPDSRWRYSRISEYVEKDRLSYTVGFDYQPEGIRIAGEWFPILKMSWVPGLTLDNYLRSLNGRFTADFADRFKKMCWDLKDAGIAHGDLQHGNIIVNEDELFLVDYDGMYVPAMQGALSNELGHRNYQHPRRNERHFGPDLDNFSAWIIYASLRALSIDDSLFEQLGACEDCLLFRRDDFINPLHSCAFAAFEGHEDETVRKLGRYVRWLLTLPPEQVPALGTTLDIPVDLPSLNPSTPTHRSAVEGAGGAHRHEQHGNNSWYKDLAAAPAAEQWQSAAVIRPPNPASMPPSLRVEHELRQPPPRKTQYNRSCNRIAPTVWQWCNLANPLLFFAMITLSNVQNDDALAKHGIDVPGTIESVRRVHHSKGGDKTQVTYVYDYDHVEHQKTTEIALDDSLPGNKPITVKILSARPDVSSPNFSPEAGPGESQLPIDRRENQMSLLFTCAAWIFCEALIWVVPLKHLNIVAKGKAVRGRITTKRERAGGRGSRWYYVGYQYERAGVHGGPYSSEMRVSKKQYDDINEGEEATIVYLPGREDTVIYRFSYYRAV